MWKFATFIVIPFMLVGCGASQSVQTPTKPKSSITYTIPAKVTWENRTYVTKGAVQTVGQQLGVTSDPGPNKVFSIPGKNPDKEIAIEVDTPNAKFVIADEAGN